MISQRFIQLDAAVRRAFARNESVTYNDGLKRLADAFLILTVSIMQESIRRRFQVSGLSGNTHVLKDQANILQFPSLEAMNFYHRAVQVLTAVTTRRTAKRQDESICIASALDIPLQRIQEFDEPSERMRH